MQGLSDDAVLACPRRDTTDFCVGLCVSMRTHLHVRGVHVHFKVKVKSSRIINVAAFYIMLNQTLELLPLEDQLSNLI